MYLEQERGKRKKKNHKPKAKANSESILTKDFDFYRTLGCVIVFVAGGARISALVGSTLDVLNQQGAILNTLSHVGGQLHTI